ncbi:restriction endonuclease subunit S [Salmonella enterica subsp. enterica serovar Umbilo]|uniref:Restriction endonuclease subunit S n=1 Tax=Salmonella enterica TaxID=28901 RepID=A0A747HK93_SALER|nr:restriction endonuclease subunit S [Salmonella enterica subsp. enterica serovar Umbilo]ECC3863706.1 restriction endonuclease subunit S [Salmonella enterica subsp. enterica]ECR5874387.1 restriction endonuclease subunit S [Salmonella enterica subsp. enterica serovar Larochelle]ECY5863941.1 restriction endonuclease subunit S [Salmonella enterica subsp. enterica serovar Albert]EDC2230638.1 restriction endonuclease subunit S [Salmonella enterica]EDX9403528.1 restriction endonuclease subunit S [S
MAVEKLIVDHIDTWTTALQTRSTAGRGSSGKIDLYGIKKLRELILELAVRGKLVPQDPNDKPASVLLERIATEKAELVKQGKIKKQKPLPEISEEEKPFELPAGWEWARLNELAPMGIIDGDWIESKDQDPSGAYRLIQLADVGVGDFKDKSDRYINTSTFHRLNCHQLMEGDILIARLPNPIGRACIFPKLSQSAITVVDIATMRPSGNYSAEYIISAINSLTFRQQVESFGKGATRFRIATGHLKTLLLPIPPVQEQYSIFKKIKELMSLCDQLEQYSLTSLDAHQQLVETLLTTLTDSQNADELAENWARISEHFDTLFTTEVSIDALKQTILQLAVMGKLVPQDPNDEPASELLKRIAQEKAQLVKDGKMKKQKPLPPISDEEKPFELPSGWEWCLFEDVVDIQSGITKGRNLANRKLISIPYLRVANVQRGYLDLSEVKEIDIPEEEKDKYHVIKGDLLITEGGDWDTVGRTTVWCHDWYIANQNHVFKGRIIGQDIDPYWLETYMNSPYARDYFASASKQTTNLASINKTQLRGCPVAIPPSSEADKIMLKLNDFNELCEKLKLKIQSAQQTQLHLADALTDAAIN